MIIYKITNKINGKIYIGQTTRSLQHRWQQHCWISSRCSCLNKAIHKYGKENFTVEQIDVACDIDELNMKEQYWIEYYDCIAPKGYNLTSGGEGYIVCEETRRKLSIVNRGRRPFLGKHHTEETRKKMSESSKGEKNPNFGKHPSDETRQRMSEAQKGRHHSEESIEKMRQAHLGRVFTEEHRRKISENHAHLSGEKHPKYGKPVSEETKRKLSNSHKGRWIGSKSPVAKKVICIETGEIFNCIKDASVVKGCSYSKIGECCKGNRKTTGGYHWEYVEVIK